MSSLHELADWIDACADSAVAAERWTVEGLALELWGCTPWEAGWLLKYLGPLVVRDAGDGECAATWKIGMFFADEVVAAVAEGMEQGGLLAPSVWNGRYHVRRVAFSPRRMLDSDPVRGTACLYDWAARRITLVTSVHTGHPVHELGRCLRDVATAWMRSRGWQIFHAGAVRSGGRDWLVVGDAGAGKTSLLIALLAGGARFIANDRVFLRLEGGTVRLRPFPMAVAIGLGTAAQYGPLRRVVRRPGSLCYPRRRLDLVRVLNTPETDWAALPDKLQLFPGELNALFRAVPGPADTTAGGILLPRLDRAAGDALTLTETPPAEARAVLARNHLPAERDPVMPSWRPLPFRAPPADDGTTLLERLLDLPAWTATFLARRESMAAVRRWNHQLARHAAARAAAGAG